MNLLERVKNLCLEKGISQRKLESDLELSNGASSKWNKSSPSGDVLQKVADYFHVSVDYLLGKIPFKNESEAHYSINIAAVKYLLTHKEEIPSHFDICSGLSVLIDETSDSDIMTYSKSLLNKFDKNLNLTDSELYELSHILFKEIKGKDYTGVIALKNFYDDSFTIYLNLDEIDKVDPNKLDLDNSLLFKFNDIPEDPTFRYNSVLSVTINTKENSNANKQLAKPTTMAAHLPEGVELTKEEQQQLNDYIQFILSRRSK